MDTHTKTSISKTVSAQLC